MTGRATIHTTRIGTNPTSLSVPLDNRATNIAGNNPACPQTDGANATAINAALKQVWADTERHSRDSLQPR